MKTNALIEFSQDEKKVIKNQFFPQGTSDQEMIFCMNVATSLGLNPILKEIYFVERKSKVNNQWFTKIEPLVGRDAFLKIAHNSGKFGGIETSVELKPTYKLVNEEWQEAKDLVATCKVYRTDTERPFVVEVAYSEYVQRKNDGTPTKFWKEKGPTMLKKVAESQALRKAFSITGVYSEDEMPTIDVDADTTTAAPRGIKQQTTGITAPEADTTEDNMEAEAALSGAGDQTIIDIDEVHENG